MAQKQTTSFPSLVYSISTLVINRPTWRSFYGLDHAGLVSYSAIEFPAVDITILVAEFGYIVTKYMCKDRLESKFFGVNECFVLVGTSNCCGIVWLVANCPVHRHLPSICHPVSEYSVLWLGGHICFKFEGSLALKGMIYLMVAFRILEQVLLRMWMEPNEFQGRGIFSKYKHTAFTCFEAQVILKKIKLDFMCVISSIVGRVAQSV